MLETNSFIIEYDKNINYIPEIVNFLELKKIEIMSFFGINKFTNKKKIIIYNDLELYKKHIEEYFEYHDHMCADSNDGNINVLSLEEAHKTKTYSNISLDELKEVILHEFVHTCQQEIQIEKIKPEDEVIWFWEALATNLGNPTNYKIIQIRSTNDEINNFNCSENNYPIAYTIGRYMLENYSHEEILDYIKYPTRLIKEADDIVNKAREWSIEKVKESNIVK